jgi:hypothetical protein
MDENTYYKLQAKENYNFGLLVLLLRYVEQNLKKG